jgi:hypothetical protein
MKHCNHFWINYSIDNQYVAENSCQIFSKFVCLNCGEKRCLGNNGEIGKWNSKKQLFLKI